MVDGASLGLIWVVPFLGLLVSIAVLPMIAPHFWHKRHGLVAAIGALAFAVPFAIRYGHAAALHEALHTLVLEYIPFVVLVGGLFTIAGGLHFDGAFRASPARNTALLALGTALASLIGTTGSSMILIRPLLRANAARRHKAHVVIFFIFLVSNIGGALSPLGDPPLFLGYLQGVPFFWPLQHLWPMTLTVSAILLALFYAIDWRLRAKDDAPAAASRSIVVHGLVNVPLLVAFVGVVVAAGGFQKSGAVFIDGIEIPVASLVRDALLLGLGALSWVLTPSLHRKNNGFDWYPALEVAKLFAGIFIAIIPALAILRAGQAGAFAPVLQVLGGSDAPNRLAYFWLTGLLSAFLDNAPTYLVFFNAAGGDANRLAGDMAVTLTAISAGAVFMGALTYIGNAPNMIVRSIAEHEGVKMPSFFGYLAWSVAALIPCFALISYLFFR